jgi:hypothetical protein
VNWQKKKSLEAARPEVGQDRDRIRLRRGGDGGGDDGDGDPRQTPGWQTPSEATLLQEFSSWANPTMTPARLAAHKLCSTKTANGPVQPPDGNLQKA